MRAEPEFVHGGPDAAGSAPHDFSTNANACGPCPVAFARVRAADAGRYPDPHSTQLRQRLGTFHGVDPARILIAASASEFIVRMTAAVARQGGQRVGLPAHSYGDYQRAAQVWGLTVARATVAPEADLVWCCDPSSPLGQTPASLAREVDAGAGRGVWVLDMAYAPLRLSGAPALDGAQRDALWQMWTPNKALGLTGVRASYAIAPLASMAPGTPALQAQLERLAPSWPLGAHGVALLAAWTSDEAQHWLAGSLDTLRAWKALQVDMLNSLGWACLPSDANFFCARPDTPYADWAPMLRAQGVRLRDCASFDLPGTVRLGVLPLASQQALRDALGRR